VDTAELADMRRVPVIVSALLVLEAARRLLRWRSCHRDKHLSRESSDTGPLEDDRKVATCSVRRRWLNARIPAAILIAGLAAWLAVAAWDEFNEASQSFAQPAKSTIVVSLPDYTKIAHVTFNVDWDPVESESVRLEIDFDTHGDIRQSCLEFGLTLSNTARLELDAFDRASGFKSINVDENTQYVTGYACRYGESNGSYQARINSPMYGNVITVNGYRATVAVPAIYFGRSTHNPYDPIGWSTEIKAAPPDGLIRVDTANPQPNLPGTLLGWRANGVIPVEADFDTPGQLGGTDETRAAITYVEREAAANRSLFIAGALAGLAGGLLPWAGQLLLDAFLNRRERA
jgi:hypothetical protein